LIPKAEQICKVLGCCSNDNVTSIVYQTNGEKASEVEALIFDKVILHDHRRTVLIIDLFIRGNFFYGVGAFTG